MKKAFYKNMPINISFKYSSMRNIKGMYDREIVGCGIFFLWSGKGIYRLIYWTMLVFM